MDWRGKTICEQLIEFANTVRDEINRNDYEILTFIVQDRKVIRFEKKLSINKDKIED
jgi:lipopolysaccharide biosynthesis glycosyltransferase